MSIERREIRQEAINKHPNIYTTRDSRGRILWHLPRNTDEENEQLGVRNMQALILEKIPEIGEFIPEDSSELITEEHRDRVKTLVLARCGAKHNCIALFGETVRYRRSAPYFLGSYKVALQKPLEAWGIRFQPGEIENRRGNHRWSKKTEEELITEAQALFRLKFPEVEEILSCQPPHRQTELKKLILSKVGTHRKFARNFSWDFIRRNRFGGGFKTAISKIFSPWGLTFETKDFQKENRKPNGFWSRSPERIEIEAMSFYQKEGKLTKDYLGQRKRWDLAFAIRYYPGGMAGLKEKLGITSDTKECISPTAADDELKKLLEGQI